jgi:hypothetical protein
LGFGYGLNEESLAALGFGYGLNEESLALWAAAMG